MAATQAAKEMRRYLKIDEVEAKTMQIEDLEETVVNAFEDVGEDEDESVEVVEQKKTKKQGLKTCWCKQHKHMNY